MSDLSEIYGSIENPINNREMLKNLESEYEGYSFSVKNLMKEITKGSLNEYEKSCSILGDTLKVKKGYEVAVEMALGGAISNIITENENQLFCSLFSGSSSSNK